MRQLRITLLYLLTLPLLAVADDRADALDALFARYTELDQFNGVAFVADGDETLLRSGYGFAEQATGTNNSAKTQFFVGSISKSFTADLVFQLVDEGLLNLDHAITDYLPYYRDDTGSQITIRHLVMHTDGLFNYTNDPKFWQPNDGEALSTQEFVETYCSSDLQFEPGSEYRYGNSGYSILGAIIEEVSGKPFAEVLHERILRPVGMPNSGDVTAGIPEDNLARGYAIGPDGFRLADPVYKPLFAAAGIYTTVDDLFTYLNSSDLEAIVDRLATASEAGAFTYGWLVAQLPAGAGGESVRVLSTNGEINGYNALLIRVIDSQQTVILFSNIGETDLVSMASNAINVLNGGSPPQPTARTRDRFYMELREQGVDAAIQYYHEQRDVDPDDYIYRPWPMRILASQLLDDGRREDAIRILQLNLETHPDDSRTLQMLESAHR